MRGSITNDFGIGFLLTFLKNWKAYKDGIAAFELARKKDAQENSEDYEAHKRQVRHRGERGR